MLYESREINKVLCIYIHHKQNKLDNNKRIMSLATNMLRKITFASINIYIQIVKWSKN